MRNSVFALIAMLMIQGCGSAGQVEFHNPLDGTPEKPSTVRAIVRSIDANLGMLRVQVSTVDGMKRQVGSTIWIDENTLFTNSGGGDDIRSWEEITGAEIVAKGWYRGDRWFADEIDVVYFPPKQLTPPIR